MDFHQAMVEVRPGFFYWEVLGADDSDDFSIVRVGGERGNQVLLVGGETPGWYERSDIAELIAGASALQSLRIRLESARAAAAASAAPGAPSP